MTLTGPQGQPVPVQLSDGEYWPGTQSVKTAKLSFLASLAPPAQDTYAVRYGDQPAAGSPLATDLTVLRGRNQVTVTTGQFGARLLLGEQTYAQAVPVTDAQVRRVQGWEASYAVGAYVLSGSPEVMSKNLLLRARKALAAELKGCLFGAAVVAPPLYDAVVDAPETPEEERPILRAWMAHYGYHLADPATWSIERGYASGNQNMTSAWVLPRGLVACTIPEHPMAKAWYREAEQLMEYYLNHMVAPDGEFREETGGHGLASVGEVLAFAIASTNSGLHDYLNDPRVKRLLLYVAKLNTPRDPRTLGDPKTIKPNIRVMPAFGRDPVMPGWAGFGVMARATRYRDPAYSAILQWTWLESGATYGNFGNKPGGFEYGYSDPSLPTQQPVWTSEVLPRTEVILRHGLGTADEHQVNLYAGHPAFYPSQPGSFPSIFAYGKPVAGAFAGGYVVQEGFLTCHVDIARNLGTMADRQALWGYYGTPADANIWNFPDGPMARYGEHGGWANVSGFSTLPRQDYAAVDVAFHYPRSLVWQWIGTLPEWPPVPAQGKPPLDWRRQVLFLKDDDPAKATYLLIRDNVKGRQPTMWQMWTVSEKIGTPDEVKDLLAFLADKPGNSIRPFRELKGDRFIAVGQLGVDVEYCVASPSDTPRYTLRWGWDGTVPNLYVTRTWEQYQDLLHLQMPGDGAYFVAFYPRKREWLPPSFSTLGDGLIIKVSGDFGTDYGFLSAREATAAGEGASFQDTAGSAQDRKSGLVLALGASGEVGFKDYGLKADMPVSLRVQPDTLVLEAPAAHAAGQVTLVAPGKWKLAHALEGATARQTPEGLGLALPQEVEKVALTKG